MVPIPGNTYSEFHDDLFFIQKYIDADNAAVGSNVDANANVSNKNIATLAAEIHKQRSIGINRCAMYEKLTSLYGVETARSYLNDLESHLVYRHDESAIVGMPYCASITMMPFLWHGLTGLGGTTTAPHNLDSFCGGFINLVFAVSAQLCGAVATPEFLTYLDYFIRREYGDNYFLFTERVVEDSSRKRTIDQVITSKFEQVVYSINQPAAARGAQSVFWNIAYFDRPYFEQIFADFVFPDGTPPLWQSVSWLQKRFMKWFNAERLRATLTFPVESLSLLNDGEHFVDDEWYKFAAQMYAQGHSFFTYTSDSVDSLASCCYTGDTEVFIRTPDKTIRRVSFLDIEREWQGKAYEIFSDGLWRNGKFVKLPGRPMYEVRLTNGMRMRLTDNHRNLCDHGMKLTRDLTVHDQLYVVPTPEKPGRPAKWVSIASVEPFEYDGPVYCFEMTDRVDDKFTLANGIHNYNCRLRNGITSNVFSYTLGAGGIATGSKCVMTINVNRLIQNAASEHKNVSQAVYEVVSRVHRYLLAVNSIIMDMRNAHMIPIYDAGFVSPQKQYLTIGVNGFVEAAEFLGIKISPDSEEYKKLARAVFGTITVMNIDARTEDVMFNTELVPAENLGVKNAKWDKRDGLFSPRECYNSYFYPVEDESLNVIDKLILQGKDFAGMCDGGAAYHCNLTDHLTQEQYEQFMHAAVVAGCNYFTFNIPNTVCNSCGRISKRYLASCPSCGSEDVDYLTRIIGYLTRISKWSKERQCEAARRHYHRGMP